MVLLLINIYSVSQVALHERLLLTGEWEWIVNTVVNELATK